VSTLKKAIAIAVFLLTLTSITHTTNKEVEAYRYNEHIMETKPLTTILPGKELKIWYNIRVSFYTNNYNNCRKSDGIGANNIRLSRGHAAFPQEFKFGTRLYVEGLNQKVHDIPNVIENQDRGGAIKILEDGTIAVDVYIPSVSDKYLNSLGVFYTRGKFIKMRKEIKLWFK
jgi:3D (Asp-Asp-Asp) domain-containing protein